MNAARFRTGRAAAAGVVLALALAGCAVGGQAEQAQPATPTPATAQGGGSQAEAGTGALRAPEAADAADAAAPTVVAADRALVRSSSALLGVTDLDASHAALVTVVRGAGGTVMAEYVSSGDGATPRPRSTSSSSGATAEDGAAAVPDWYWDRYTRFVDVSFTVPSTAYDATLDRVRALGRVVHLQQNVTDVTAAVADVDARIASARASVARVQALLARAETIAQVLQIEAQLASRQANLESLQAQQRSLAGQVASSTVTVRLVPADAIAQPAEDETSWWSTVGQAVTKAWQGLGFVIAVTSPVWVVGLLLALLGWLLWRRHSRRRAVSQPTAGQPAPGQPVAAPVLVTTVPGTVRPDGAPGDANDGSNRGDAAPNPPDLQSR